jgi:DNA mismatch repair protein MutS
MTTPSRRQYLDIKALHPDALLMYQVGDFFEFFDEDARVASHALQIVLTSRSFGQGQRSPLCGVPVHALETYAGRLVAQGYKVAVCEQVEQPGRGLVRRAVTRVLTPGTVAEPALLVAGRDNYLVAVVHGHPGGGSGRGAAAGLAWVEASTGAFACTQWTPGELPDALRAELQRIGPAEVLVSEAQSSAEADGASQLALWLEHVSVTTCPPHYFDRESSRVRLCRHLGTPTLGAFGCEELPLAVAACGAILAYLERMNPGLLRLVTGLTTYRTEGFVEVDGRTWAALEVVEPARGSVGGLTLLATLDATRTAMGARLLRRTLLHPLRDRNALERRLDGVAALYGDAALRQRLAAALDGLADLERLSARIVQGRAQSPELHALAASLARVPTVREALRWAEAGALAEVTAQLEPCPEVVRLVESAVALPEASEGRILRRGYSEELDAVVDSIAASRHWIASLERVERERTGIKSLRVSYNQVFGYGIEVTRPNLSRVPERYERRQTLVGGERFVTAELKEHEARVLQAEERIAALERELYAGLLDRLAAHHARLRAVAGALGQLDVWLGLAEVAERRGYVRPELADDRTLEILGGRHPVVEAALEGSEFIPNDTDLSTSVSGETAHAEAREDTEGEGGGTRGDKDYGEGRVLLLTGPNMAGKSTYLRQVALIVLLAQVGSFVPARHARVGLVDRIFTRVGADDDLARGISTFMREMMETAYILRHATARSLVVLDEVGRGTSTHDGLAIARAVVEHLHDCIGARTLFATHFHELADLAESLPGARLTTMAVQERDGQVVFLHRLVAGHASRSYGVHVARMAGLPSQVTARAAVLLDGLAPEVAPARGEGALIARGPRDAAADARKSLAKTANVDWRATQSSEQGHALARLREPGAHEAPASANGDAPSDGLASAREVMLALASLNIAAMTPIEAINLLFSLQQRAAGALRTRWM